MSKAVLEKKWEETQKKTFTKWCNMHLGKRGMTCTDVSVDFRDGIKLVNLLEVIGAEPLPKINKNPRMKINQIENVNVALQYVASKNVKLVSISAEDIVDGNLKLTLGMIWTIILRFAIADISEEELSAKEALLLWCKKKCAPYNVPVENFTTHWQSGLAFIALIHAHRPELVPNPTTLNPSEMAANVKLAFDVADRDLGIPQLLDVEDVVDVPKPDERSVMTYVSLYYHKFASSRKAEVAARRVGKLVDLTMSNDQLKQNYNDRAGQHVQWVKKATGDLNTRDFPNSLDGIKNLIDEFNKFKTEERPPKQAEKLALESLNNTIAMKLNNAGRPAFKPNDGLAIGDIDRLWDGLDNAQHDRNQALLDELARQNKLDLLKRRFNSNAKRLEDWNHKQSDYLAVDETVDSINEAQTKLMALDAFEKEYGDSKPRVDELNQLAAAIANEKDQDAPQITERSASITDTWNGHKPKAQAKREDLEKKLKQQQEMEALRKKFAEDAKEYKRWEKSSEADVRDDTFGNNLEAVVAYKATIDADDATRNADNDSKKAGLDSTWKQLQDLGVTENRYTVLTDKDVDSLHNQLQSALKARQDAYAAELARQQLLEEKRKEFAAGAQNFVDSLETRKAELSALQGEPAELSALIREAYKDGQPEKEKLSALSSLSEEMGRLGIEDNRHTKYTIPILDQQNAAFARWVFGRLAQLDVEADEKNEYAQKARALIEWVDATVPKVNERNFDNTLEGARSKSEEWSLFKNGERAHKHIEKQKVLALFEQTNADLAANGRPAFVAPAGLAPSEVQAKWDQFETAEKSYDAAVTEELARQEKLFGLNRTFNNLAEDLEGFHGKKAAYLDRPIAINTLDQALLELMHLDAHDQEHASRQTNVDNAKGLKEELTGLNYHKIDDVNNRLNGISNTRDQQANKSASNRKALEEAKALEQKKENLRLDYADKAVQYTKFANQAADNAADTAFGITLESVTAFKAELDEKDAQVRQASNERKSAITQVSSELQSLGVTDNKHTNITLADIDASEKHLNDALEARQKAYAAELARQQLLEEKRKEWARLAQEFVASLDKRNADITELYLKTDGCPDKIATDVKALYADGAPEEEQLRKLTELQAENAKIGITDNRHTEYDIPSLQLRSQQLGKHTRQVISQLAVEGDAKKQYTDNAKAVDAWVSGVKHDPNFDNTLDGALAKNSDFQEWKTTEKAQWGIKRLALGQQLEQLQGVLGGFGRPSFTPAAGTSPSDLSGKWDALDSSDKAHEQAIEAEVAHQQKLFGQARDFNLEADDLEAWIKKSEAYLTTVEDCPTLDSALLKLMQLDAADEQHRSFAPRFDAEKQLQGDLSAAKYHKQADIDTRGNKLTSDYARLAELSAAKRQALLADRAREQKKEDLRLDWAGKAKEYSKYVKDTSSTVGDHNFGLTLEDVVAYDAPLTKSEQDVTAANDSKRAALNAVSAELQSSGANDNRHTKQTDADVEANHAALADALAKRRAAYNAELARLQEDDKLRRDWAGKAQGFADWVGAQRSALDKIEGEPAARFEAVKALHQDGKPGRAKLDELAADNSALQGRGVFSNQYTPHTMQTLETLNKLFNDAVVTNVGAINEEQEMNERGASQEAEWKRKEALEQARIDFANRCKALDGWMENALDVLTDPINVDSVEGVEILQAATAKVDKERAGHAPEYDHLTGAEKDLKAQGADVNLGPITEKWNEVGSALAARKDALAAEHDKQKHNDKLCKDFANTATDLEGWLKSETNTLAQASTGDLEAQLPKVQARQGIVANGKSKLDDLASLSGQIESAGIRSNKYTDLTLNNLKAQYEELETAIASQVSALQKELLAKKDSQASPQQIDEFKEVFAHFDKGNKGALRDFEFKACLNSLGESPNDAELAKLMSELGNKDRLIPFENFVDFMIKFSSDNITHNEIAESFREIANDKEFVTEEDLRRVLPGEKVDYLISNMPAYPGVPNGFDYKAWADSAFAR